jgi:hypothetical protein
MAYGITIINNSGRTTIDENSRQIQVLKTGTIVPKPIGRSYSTSFNPFRYGGSANPAPNPIIVPGTLSNSLIFFHPKRTSGTGTTYSAFHVGAHLGTCTVQWTSTAATVSGTNYIYASYTVSSATRDFAQSSAGSAYGSTPVNNDPLADTLGDAVGTYGNWAGGSSVSSNYIQNIETTGTSGVYKLTLNGTWNSTGQSSGSAAKAITKKVVWFYCPNNSGFVANYNYNTTMQNQYTLEYKFGKLTDTAEESAGYGLEIFNSSGSLAFSSNRVNFQIESITTGDTDVVAGSGTGKIKTGSGTPTNVIYDTVDDPSNYSDYYIMLTGAGDQAAFAGSGSVTTTYGSDPYQHVYGVGYAFCPVGGSTFMNSTMGHNLGTLSTTQNIGSTNAGMSMSSIHHSYSKTGSQISGSGSYVNDTWALEASRSLVIGRFI